jgi:Uma2 family endonuclease
MIHPVSEPARKATADDLAALHGEDSRYEIIHGEILEKAMGREQHSARQGGMLTAIARRFDRTHGGRWPGGWFIRLELHVQYQTDEIFCHDLCGYRRDLHPSIPRSWPIKIRPEWVCELISPGHEKRDMHDKRRVLQGAGVPHYWIVNPEERLLTVYRLENGGYSLALTATSGDIVRAEPFDAVELRVSVLFGDEDDDD